MPTLRTTFTVRQLEAHEWQTHREIRLRALADAPDAFGTTLAEAQARRPDAWAARMSLAAVSGRDYPLSIRCPHVKLEYCDLGQVHL